MKFGRAWALGEGSGVLRGRRASEVDPTHGLKNLRPWSVQWALGRGSALLPLRGQGRLLRCLDLVREDGSVASLCSTSVSKALQEAVLRLCGSNLGQFCPELFAARHSKWVGPDR